MPISGARHFGGPIDLDQLDRVIGGGPGIASSFAIPTIASRFGTSGPAQQSRSEQAARIDIRLVGECRHRARVGSVSSPVFICAMSSTYFTASGLLRRREPEHQLVADPVVLLVLPGAAIRSRIGDAHQLLRRRAGRTRAGSRRRRASRRPARAPSYEATQYQSTRGSRRAARLCSTSGRQPARPTYERVLRGNLHRARHLHLPRSVRCPTAGAPRLADQLSSARRPGVICSRIVRTSGSSPSSPGLRSAWAARSGSLASSANAFLSCRPSRSRCESICRSSHATSSRTRPTATRRSQAGEAWRQLIGHQEVG